MKFHYRNSSNNQHLIIFFSIFLLQENQMKTIDYIRNSTEDQWCWVKETPSGLGLFFNKADLLACVVKRLEQIPEIDVVDIFTRANENIPSGDTVLHVLAEEPVNETKMDAIMDLLQKGFEPGLKNNAKKSFLDISTIRDKLLPKIQLATDEWASGIVTAWTCNIGGRYLINSSLGTIQVLRQHRGGWVGSENAYLQYYLC